MFNLMESSVVVKVFRLLEVLGASPSGCTLAEATDGVSMPKPTVHRLLKLMAGLGYVAQTEDGLYLLTSRIDQLRRPAADRRLLAAADPHLSALHRLTGENVNLGVLRGDRVVYLRVLESTHALRRIAEPNSTDPVHCTALGRSIAAFLDQSQREALLRRTEPFARRTPHTVTELDEIRTILDCVRVQGHSIERNETDIGVACYGAPVFEGGAGAASVVAAVSLSVPSARCEPEQEERLIKLLRDAAANVSRSVIQS